MPSLTLWPQSGGNLLCPNNIFSGTKFPASFLTLYLSNSGAGPVYVALPHPGQPGRLSGFQGTENSGGPAGSGGPFNGLRDGMMLVPGKSYTIPEYRLVSGILTPRIVCPAGSSGTRLYWDADVQIG